MLEIAIIITVSLLIILLLKNYPKGYDEMTMSGGNESKMKIKFISKLFENRRLRVEEQIKQSLNNGMTETVSPKEVSNAQDDFGAKDPEIARLLFEANEALIKEDYSEVEKKSLEAISKDKKCDQAYAFIAQIALKKGDLSDSLEAAETSIKCNSDNALAHYVLGEVYFQTEKYNDSIDHYTKATHLSRTNAEWLAGLGKAFLEVRQFSKAAKALKRASMLDINNEEYKKLAVESEEKQKSHSRVFRSF